MTNQGTDVTHRATRYLGNGGLFNPELMDHNAVSQLVRDMRDRIWALEHQLLEQRSIGHGEGQEHTIADVNAGRIDDLIAPRLAELAICKDGHHHFGNHNPICRCGEIDVRNDPPTMACPTCGGSGEVEEKL